MFILNLQHLLLLVLVETYLKGLHFNRGSLNFNIPTLESVLKMRDLGTPDKPQKDFDIEPKQGLFNGLTDCPVGKCVLIKTKFCDWDDDFLTEIIGFGNVIHGAMLYLCVSLIS